MVQLYRNHLLASLPEASRERLVSALEQEDLPVRSALVEPRRETTFVYFVESGLASVVAISRDEAEEIEVGHIGFEGMAGFHMLLGMDRTLTRTFMQVAGSGWRIPADVLRAAATADEVLRDHLLRYVHTYQMQLAHSALANGRYTIPERLARWLLMCHDRLGTDAMPLTHEFLALMLGVRRSGVTNELHALEGKHAIRASRGLITVVDRVRLERLAGEIYGAPEAEYEAVFGPFRTQARSKHLSLAGLRVLIVEDDFDLAMQMKRHMMTQGVEVVGPSPSVQDALRLLMATPGLDAAIVDVNLRGEMSFPLAEALRKRGVPFIFVSGYGQDLIPAHLEDIDFYNKPIELPALTAALVAVA